MIKIIEKDNDVIYLSAYKKPEIDPPPYSKCKNASQKCHPCYAGYLDEIQKLEDGWYDVANSGGVFKFCVENKEIIHSYRFAPCSGELMNEYHKEGKVKDWESVKDLHNK